MSEGSQNTYLCVVCLMVGLCSPKASIKVQILRFLPHGRVAQLVERQIEDLGADSSNPSLPTNYTGVGQFGRSSGLGPEGREFESLHPYH